MLKIKYKIRGIALLSLMGLAAAVVSESAKADPCGMVPPIYIGPGSPIARTGLQQTYVFFDNGIESFVIRPGFTGKVDNFGMLIPFPTPPAIRKVPDNVFAQIKNAIDPPEVVIDLRPQRSIGAGMAEIGAGGGAGLVDELEEEDRLEVLNQEAVGMYEVAVLSAGSAKALKKWMDENKFQYPAGMDKVTNEYVELGWCFVAVKTKVSEKSSADPKPGQRKLNPGMPAGATFDGAVQGLGFRFRSEELVVPMRLSAFNEGEMRNVVYLLTRGGKRIRSIPEEYVVRQLSGKQLVKNLTEPLPLRVVGMNEQEFKKFLDKRKQFSERFATNYKKRRDPSPHNGVAKSLFAADVYACKMLAKNKHQGGLSLEHESNEKKLLNVGEHFGLRGPEYDSLLETHARSDSAHLFDEISEDLAELTLTVVDGDFPRDVVANENLTFERFRMSKKRNSANFYDAKFNGPGPVKRGRLISFDNPDPFKQQHSRNLQVSTSSLVQARDTLKNSPTVTTDSTTSRHVGISAGFLCIGFLLISFPYSRRNKKG